MAPYLNSSYYIMMLDAVGEYQHDHPDNSYGIIQAEWFRSVVENNPADHIVVAMHYSPYGNNHRETNKNVLKTWGPVFDEVGVDIVISGHDHVYARTYPMYDDAIAEDGGTVYYSIGFAGHKLINLHDSGLENYAYYQSAVESVIILMSIADGALTFTTINQNGDIIDGFAFAG